MRKTMAGNMRIDGLFGPARAGRAALLVLALAVAACGGGDKGAAPGGAPAKPEAAKPTEAKPAAPAAEGAAAPAAAPAAEGAASAAAAPAAAPAAVAPAAAAAAVPADAAACDTFKAAVCKEAGEQSEACTSATSAAKILSPAACATAQADMPAILAKAASLQSVCKDLAEKLCKDLGPDTQTCAMVKERTPGFPADRCTMMLGEYPKVLAELQAMEKQNQPLDPALRAKQEANDAPSFGPADAKVTIVEYSDFECPYCSMAAQTTTKIKEKYGDRVRIVFRQFPLGFHQNALPAAEASLAANAQGKFWQMHDIMFENQKALDRASLETYAQQIGLDVDAFKAALDNKTFEAQAKADMKLGEEVGVNGTPTLFVGAERVQNPGDFDAISKQIDAALAKAQ
jgi:protein-disulfide isomerase